jgi:hypothetical protein
MVQKYGRLWTWVIIPKPKAQTKTLNKKSGWKLWNRILFANLKALLFGSVVVRIHKIRIFRASRIQIVSIFTDPDPSINMQKSKKKHYFYYILSLHFVFLSSKTVVNVPSKSKKPKNLLFVDILSATDERSKIRIHKSVVRIRGYGSVPKCHGSTKLLFGLFVNDGTCTFHSLYGEPVGYRYTLVGSG